MRSCFWNIEHEGRNPLAASKIVSLSRQDIRSFAQTAARFGHGDTFGTKQVN